MNLNRNVIEMLSQQVKCGSKWVREWTMMKEKDFKSNWMKNLHSSARTKIWVWRVDRSWELGWKRDGTLTNYESTKLTTTYHHRTAPQGNAEMWGVECRSVVIRRSRVRVEVEGLIEEDQTIMFSRPVQLLGTLASDSRSKSQSGSFGQTNTRPSMLCRMTPATSDCSLMWEGRRKWWCNCSPMAMVDGIYRITTASTQVHAGMSTLVRGLPFSRRKLIDRALIRLSWKWCGTVRGLPICRLIIDIFFSVFVLFICLKKREK